MILNLVRELLGAVPSPGGNSSVNYDIIEYLVSALVLIFLLSLAYRMIISIFGRN